LARGAVKETARTARESAASIKEQAPSASAGVNAGASASASTRQ